MSVIIEVSSFHLELSALDEHSRPFLMDAPVDKPTATLRGLLRHALRTLRKSSKKSYHLLQGVEDLFCIYFVGKWHSIDAFKEFSRIDECGELLHVLQCCKATVTWAGAIQYPACYSLEGLWSNAPIRQSAVDDGS